MENCIYYRKSDHTVDSINVETIDDFIFDDKYKKGLVIEPEHIKLYNDCRKEFLLFFYSDFVDNRRTFFIPKCNFSSVNEPHFKTRWSWSQNPEKLYHKLPSDEARNNSHYEHEAWAGPYWVFDSLSEITKWRLET